MKRLVVVVALAVAACGAENTPETPEDPRPLVLATFSGEVDAVAGTFTVRPSRRRSARPWG